MDETKLSAFFVVITALSSFILCLFLEEVKKREREINCDKKMHGVLFHPWIKVWPPLCYWEERGFFTFIFFLYYDNLDLLSYGQLLSLFYVMERFRIFFFNFQTIGPNYNLDLRWCGQLLSLFIQEFYPLSLYFLPYPWIWSPLFSLKCWVLQ